METLQVNSSIIQGTINEMTFSFALKGSRIVKGWRWETAIFRKRNSERKGTDE